MKLHFNLGIIALMSIIIDETSIKYNLSLVIRKFTYLKFKLAELVLYDVSLNL